MKMYIPELGDKIKLQSDWTFEVYDERRNESLFSLLNFTSSSYFLDKGKLIGKFTISKGEELIIDRIYIRKGNSQYSSVTVRWNKKDFGLNY